MKPWLALVRGAARRGWQQAALQQDPQAAAGRAARDPCAALRPYAPACAFASGSKLLHTSRTLRDQARSGQGAEVAVGHTFRLERVFTQEDVDAFAKVSGDLNPMHQAGSEVALSSIFKGPVVHGMLVASMFTALIGTSVPGSIYRSQELKFVAPVFPGEKIVATVEVLTIREGAPGKMRMSKMKTTCSKGGGGELVVIEGVAVCMLPAA